MINRHFKTFPYGVGGSFEGGGKRVEGKLLISPLSPSHQNNVEAIVARRKSDGAVEGEKNRTSPQKLKLQMLQESSFSIISSDERREALLLGERLPASLTLWACCLTSIEWSCDARRRLPHAERQSFSTYKAFLDLFDVFSCRKTRIRQRRET